MDPLSLAASVAGLMSLTLDVSHTVDAYALAIPLNKRGPTGRRAVRQRTQKEIGRNWIKQNVHRQSDEKTDET